MNFNNNNNNDNNNNKNYSDDTEVAIVGVGFRIPGCSDEDKNASKLWNLLINKFDGVKETSERWSDNFNKLGDISSGFAGLLPLNELKSFDPLFFGINPSEAPLIDPQQRLLLKCTWEAMEDAMIDPLSVRGTSCSVYIGSSTTDYQEVNKNELKSNYFSSTAHSIANRVSYCFDLRGESITLDTACSSSLNAIRLGFKSVRDNTCSLSIVGGVNLIIDTRASEGFSNLKIFTKTGKCRSFDADGDGFARAETAGVVVLKPLKQAIADGNNIYCVINGASSNVDGNGLSDKSNFFQPSSNSQSENIKLAFKSTNGLVTPSDVHYVEAHGTGTPTGDPIEAKSISMAFNGSNHNSLNPLLIGSIKSNIGHGEASSGVASVIKCCLMFKNQCFAPNIHFNKPNPNIKFDEWNLKVVTEPTPFPKYSKNPISMVISNFGISGSNCCLILSQPKKQNQQSIEPLQSNEVDYLIPFSANSVNSLNKYQSLIVKQQQQEQQPFSEFVKFQIKSKTNSLYQRSVIISSNWNQFIDSYNNNNNKFQTTNSKTSNISISSNNKNPLTVFICCGQGSQYTKMGLELYNSSTVFKNSMDFLDKKLSVYYGYSLLDKLRSINDDDIVSINDPIIAQPTICMLQISLLELYKSWGIEPSFVIGHSLGEITSAYCSNMIDLDTFCYLIYHRSKLQSKTNGCGKMLSINITKEEFNSIYSKKYPLIEIACYNSPSSIVLAGNEDHLLEILNDSKNRNIFSAMLGSLSSFHTSSQFQIKDEVINLKIQNNKSTIPTFSTVTTDLFNSTPFDSKYVFENIVKPVKFSQTISNLYKHIETNKLGNNIVFIELSPHPTLSFYLKQMIPSSTPQDVMNGDYFSGGTISIYSPLNKKKNDTKQIQETISQLYCQNSYNINFNSQFANINSYNYQTHTIKLPTYQWDDQIYWNTDSYKQEKILNGPPIDSLGHSNKDNCPLLKSYETVIDIGKQPFKYLKGHQLNGGKFIFPGCGYLYNLLKIYKCGEESQNLISINWIEFKSPLNLIEGHNQQLQTNIYQTSKNEFRSQFHYKDKKTNEWVNSSNCIFQLLSTNQSKEHISQSQETTIFELIEKEFNLTKLNKNQIYSFIKSKLGISYSGSFQRIDETYMGYNDNSISSIGLLPNETSLSITLLDSFLQCPFTLIEDNCQIVLDRIEGINYYNNFIMNDGFQGVNLYVLSKLKSRFGNSFFASITVMTIEGSIILEVENVVYTSLSQIKDSLVIEYQSNYFYSPYLQLKDSQIKVPLSFKQSYTDMETNIEDNLLAASKSSYHKLLIPSLLLNNLIQRIPNLTITDINNLTNDQLKEKYSNNIPKGIQYERLFKFVFETIKSGSHNLKENSDSSDITLQVLNKSTKIISNILFPASLNNCDEDIQPSSLFEDGLLDKFYSIECYVTLNNQLVGEIIKQTIRPLVKEKMVFRILEFGGGVCSLSIRVLEKINELLNENPLLNEIDIEFTWSDISPSFIPDAKKKLSGLISGSNTGNVNIIYRSLDLEKPLNDTLKPQYFDFVIMSNVLHAIKDIKFGLNEIYKILSPKGQLLFIEPLYKSIILDSIFGVFDQWWTFEDTDIRNDRCYMTQESWYNVLNECNFKNTFMSKAYDTLPFIIQTQKPSIESSLKTDISVAEVDNVIVYYQETDSDSTNQLLNFISNVFKNRVIKISNINRFKEIKNIITNQTIIFFIKPIEQLEIDNFKSITFEYIQINQILLELNLKCKHVLITKESLNNNYLAASVLGATRYFDEYINQLELFSLDFSGYDKMDHENFENIIYSLVLNSKSNTQREYFIINNKIYYERYKKESSFNFKSNFKSLSYYQQKTNDKKSLVARLDTNLEYKLCSTDDVLKPNQVRVKVISSSINYKDYLVYRCLVPAEIVNRNGDINKPEIGLDFSGIVLEVGDGEMNQFKIGDHVYGIAYDSSSSQVIVDKECLIHKPLNISHSQAASIPAVYLTSYYSMYKVGNLQEYESILIHSATGGVGLSALELLKWKGHKSPIFVTVGSQKKAIYIMNRYGDLITACFSSKNKNFVFEIKEKLLEMGWCSKNAGVDLIINTLSSSEFIDSNFNCLAPGGRIIDLSITHLNQNEYTVNSKFKYNYGYHNIEIQLLVGTLFNRLFKPISNAIENGELGLIPVIEFSNLDIKNAIEFINKRQHIGKIIVNHYTDIVEKKIKEDKDQLSILKPVTNYETNYLGKNIIVTGQSGIILDILKWIVKFNSKTIENIIILSKSKLKWELEKLINKTISSSDGNHRIKFHFNSVDIGDSEKVDETIKQILSNNNDIKNIDSIFHFAFSQITRNVNDIDMNSLDVSHGAKTLGAINLHNQSIKYGWKLLNFIMASSVAGVFGSTSQCSYVSSCNVIDSFSRYRKSIGLPSISTNWGAFGETGFVNRNESVEAMVNGQGIDLMTTNQILGALDLQIQNQNKSTNLMVNNINLPVYKSKSNGQKLYEKLDFILNSINNNNSNNNNNNNNINNNQKDKSVKEIFIDKVSEFLSIESSKINTDIKLTDYGIDSLLTVQLKNWLDAEFSKPNIVSTQQFQSITISSIIQIINSSLST